MLRRVTKGLERTPLALALLGVALAGLAAACGGAGTGEPSAVSPAPSREPVVGRTEIATFAAGCFWGAEAHFADLPGVVDAVAGYTGGTTAEPTYEQVCSGETGHAEAVRVEFDPDVITYEELVESFFGMHDPTTPDRQGPDVGTQYRSAVFFHTPLQEATAVAVTERLGQAGAFDDPIVTEIVAGGPFWRAEDYHQDYFVR
jgi:peptide-methionine (S)-S-oxide reductase